MEIAFIEFSKGGVELLCTGGTAANSYSVVICFLHNTAPILYDNIFLGKYFDEYQNEPVKFGIEDKAKNINKSLGEGLSRSGLNEFHFEAFLIYCLLCKTYVFNDVNGFLFGSP